MPGGKLIHTANIWLPCTEYVISAGLLWWIGLSVIGGFSKVQKYQQVWKKWNLENEIVASTFNLQEGRSTVEV